MKQFGALLTILFFIGTMILPTPAMAVGFTDSQLHLSGINSAYSYVQPTDPSLMTVSILGAFGGPGIYHLPIRTDLVTAISIAGGPSNAVMDSLTVKRSTSAIPQIFKFDLERSLQGAEDHNLILQPNDVLYIEERKPWISSNVLGVLSIVSSVIGLTVAGLFLSREFN